MEEFENTDNYSGIGAEETLRKARERAQEILSADRKKAFAYNNLWRKLSPELAEKFLIIVSLADNNDWFKQFYKYIDINFFKDKDTDALVFVVEFMLDAIKNGKVCDMGMVRHYVSNMKETQFQPKIDADDFKKEIIMFFNELADVPEKIERQSLNTLLLLCLQRNIMRRTLSDPQVFLARGIDVNDEAELQQLLNDENLMMDIIYEFPEEREFVSRLITSISKIDDPRDI